MGQGCGGPTQHSQHPSGRSSAKPAAFVCSYQVSQRFMGSRSLAAWSGARQPGELFRRGRSHRGLATEAASPAAQEWVWAAAQPLRSPELDGMGVRACRTSCDTTGSSALSHGSGPSPWPVASLATEDAGCWSGLSRPSSRPCGGGESSATERVWSNIEW